MMDVLEVLMRKIYDEVDILSDALSHGGAKSYEEYRYMTGVVRGLETVVEMIEQLTPKEDDDE
jgi:hypothetical protein